VADVTNLETIHALAKRAKVFIDCVGPFRLYGEPVVRICIENNTDYIDISGKYNCINFNNLLNLIYILILKGEVEYIERIQLTYDEPARSKNVSVIPACGYDSVCYSNPYL
jgi:short subunit dehydrogenase-like uncharacterized protein